MSFYQNGILISGVNTLPELTRAQYEALPADKRPEYWVCLDEEYEPSSSGHTIENTDGTEMPQEENLQFVGLKVTDDSTNGRTIVDATDKVTWKANGILGAKQLIPFPYYEDTETDRGITWINNDDGTLTVSGTATADSAHNLSDRTQENGIYLKNGTYTLSGCPSSGSNSTYYLEAVITKNSSAYRLGIDDGNSITFTVSGDDFGNDGAYVMIRGIVKNTIAISSNLTFKPMLRLAEDTDDTYQPHAMTNRELTVGKASQAEVDDIVNVYGAKQMIEYPYRESSVTRDGITYTDNGDGTITANGTATANANFYIGTLKPIKKGTYTLTNGLNNSPTTYKMRIRLTTDHGTTYSSVDLNDEKVTFTVEQDCEYNIYLWVVSGVTVSNVTFKPLLTPASITNRTYEPYAMTNQQLTDKIATKEDIIPFNTFSITASNWTANSDSATSSDYPYVYSVTTDKYTADSTPVWDLAGAGAIPTSTERESINMILEAVFSTSGVTLYATDEPTSDLTLRVKGK